MASGKAEWVTLILKLKGEGARDQKEVAFTHLHVIMWLQDIVLVARKTETNKKNSFFFMEFMFQ